MSDEKLYLTPQEIYEHDFKIDTRGYCPQEVDNYLDMIIRDYTEYNSIIKELKNKLKILTEDNSSLKEQIRHLQDALDSANESSNREPKTITNIDLLKRISALEKAVYGENK
jgi:DivIVA domain-containing protein